MKKLEQAMPYMEAFLPGMSGGQRAMMHKVKFTHSDKSHAHITSAKIREGREIYRHPKRRFVVLEFQEVGGKFREAFWPEDII